MWATDARSRAWREAERRELDAIYAEEKTRAHAKAALGEIDATEDAIEDEWWVRAWQRFGERHQQRVARAVEVGRLRTAAAKARELASESWALGQATAPDIYRHGPQAAVRLSAAVSELYGSHTPLQQLANRAEAKAAAIEVDRNWQAPAPVPTPPASSVKPLDLSDLGRWLVRVGLDAPARSHAERMENVANVIAASMSHADRRRLRAAAKALGISLPEPIRRIVG